MHAWWRERRVQAVLPHAGILGLAFLIEVAGVATREPRVFFFFGLPVTGAQFLFGTTAAGGLAAVLAAMSLGPSFSAGFGVALPLYLAGVWGAAILAVRGFQAEMFKLNLAREEDQVTSSDLNSSLARERERINASRQRIEKIHMLTSLASELSSTLDLRSVVSTTLARTRELTGQAGTVKLVQFEDQGVRAYTLQDGNISIAREDADPLSVWIRKRALPLTVSDLPRDLRFREAEGELPRIRSLIGAPLIREHAVFGVLQVSSEAAEAFSAEDWRLLALLADLASVAVQNAQLYARTQEEAITDGLTEVFVHRYFHERLVEEMKRAREQSAPLTLLMADIDNFKGVNDTFGHLAGDAVLKRIARVLREGIRGTDLVARYGGEEFAVLLVETTREPAHLVAERLRAAVEALPLAELGVDRPVTVSVGMASFPGDASDERGLIERADECLYAAKRGGKNRVVVAGA